MLKLWTNNRIISSSLISFAGGIQMVIMWGRWGKRGPMQARAASPPPLAKERLLPLYCFFFYLMTLPHLFKSEWISILLCKCRVWLVTGGLISGFKTFDFCILRIYPLLQADKFKHRSFFFKVQFCPLSDGFPFFLMKKGPKNEWWTVCLSWKMDDLPPWSVAADRIGGAKKGQN